MYLLQHTYTFDAVNDCTSYISFTVIYREHFENVHFYIYIDYQIYSSCQCIFFSATVFYIT